MGNLIAITAKHLPAPRRRWAAGGRLTPWSFVYVFFSNGTPFDAPNRSETCPLG
jgi:hypothetical protein